MRYKAIIFMSDKNDVKEDNLEVLKDVVVQHLKEE